MKILNIITLAIFLTLPFSANADARKWEWFGTYSMNHDGWKGTLSIRETKADCMSPKWCDMTIRYRTSKGKSYRGHITKINNKGQHMTFYIHFPHGQQRFDAYLFSWDKRKMSGITYSGGRKFGFYAFKR